MPSSPMPGSWPSFLRVAENKDDLFKFLALTISGVRAEGKVINTTHGTTVLSSIPIDSISMISPCSHEEADSRMMLHIAHCVDTESN